MLRLTSLLILTFFGALVAATAAPSTCNTSINGEIVSLQWDDDDNDVYQNMTIREALFHGWGKIDCPTFVTLRFLTPDLTDDERGPFCLQYDRRKKTYTGFSLGQRDAYLRCRRPSKQFCERVNDSKDAALAITGLAGGASAGATAAASAAGVTAVTHSSGAVILTGTGGYIAGTLGTAGASLLAFLTAPVTLTAAAVSVVAVGGAVYACRDA